MLYNNHKEDLQPMYNYAKEYLSDQSHIYTLVVTDTFAGMGYELMNSEGRIISHPNGVKGVYLHWINSIPYYYGQTTDIAVRISRWVKALQGKNIPLVEDFPAATKLFKGKTKLSPNFSVDTTPMEISYISWDNLEPYYKDLNLIHKHPFIGDWDTKEEIEKVAKLNSNIVANVYCLYIEQMLMNDFETEGNNRRISKTFNRQRRQHATATNDT